MRELGGHAKLCDRDTDTHTDRQTQPFIIKDSVSLNYDNSSEPVTIRFVGVL